EEGTGRAIAASGIPRDELFVTTKLWNAEQGHDSALRAFDASLSKLGLDYVDLYLIHWPVPGVDKYVDTWKAFEKIAAEGRAKAIGLSNFHPAHIQRLLSETEIAPVIDQVELHPQFQQSELRAFNARHNIVTEAWSPLGQGKGLLEDERLGAIAEKHGKSPAQVVLRWHLDLGNVVIPKSVTPSRIAENIDVFDFELDAQDLTTINAMDSGNRLGPDPDTFNLV
ncbi:aldo/keto reductase, partial [Streptomyces sp. MCAF7]